MQPMTENRAGRTPRVERPAVAAPRPGIRPGVAFGLLGAALIAWIGVFMWQLSRSPAQRHVEAGDEFAQQGRNLDAVREWEIALKLDPKNADVQQLLGQSYYSGGKWRRAIEDLLQVDRLRPETPHINAMLASCFLQIGDPGAAMRYAAEELKRKPNDLLALETGAAAQTRLGDALEERRFLERLVQLQPRNRDHLITLAELGMNARDFAECRSLADRVLQLDADNAEAHAMRGISAFFIDGSPDGMRQSESDLLHGLSYSPDAYYCHLYLGRIYRRLARYPQALDHLKEAVRLNSNKADAYFDLASVYELSGQGRMAEATRQRFQSLADETEAVLHLKKQIESRPDDFNLLLQVGLMTLKQHDLSAAALYLQRAGALRPQDGQVQQALEQLSAARAASNIMKAPASAAAASNSPGVGGR